MVTSTFLKESSSSNTISDKITNKPEMTEEIIEEPNFSDAEDYVDPVEDSELLEDVLRAKPNEDESIDAVVVVDGIPKVGQDKLPRLKNILTTVFSKVGKVLSDYYPEGPNPEQNGQITTKGYCFVEYASKNFANDAVFSLNGYQLDKNHSFIVTMFKDFEKYKNYNTDDKWETPKARTYKDRGNLRSFLLHPDGFDQFVLQSENGDRIGVYWNSKPDDPTMITEKIHWSDTFVRWSPYGSYLASVHRQGIALWGGDKFEQIQKFDHPNAMYLDFSPCENYFVTYAPPKTRYTDTSDAVKIWAVRTGELKRSFTGTHVKKWPHFKWSSDDKYFATITKDEQGQEFLSVYDSTSFGLLDKKSVKLDGIRDFQWSPTEPIIAYWVAEKGQTPGRVAIMKFPEKTDLRSKNMFNLAEASIHWQKSGENLCFKVDRYAKKKEEKEGEIKYSHISIQLEIFHMRNKEYPVSMQEIKETVQAFAFEPYGNKFCIVQGDMRTFIAFFNVKSNPVAVSHIKTLDHRAQVNNIFWAPMGQYVVFAGLKTVSSGALVFVDSSQPEIVVTNVQEHTGVTDVEWDPTGRYVVSSVSAWSASRGLDYGYMMWNFQGRLLARRPVDRFCTLSWRPRPPSLLSEDKKKEIKKNMKKYAAEFDEKDKRKLDKASQEVSEKRQAQIAEFRIWREEQRERYADEKAQRKRLRGGEDTDEAIAGAEVDEETIEYLISQEEQVAE